MLCDWQLANFTGSLLDIIISTAYQGRSRPLRVFFIFLPGRCFYAKFTASAAITNSPTAAANNPSIVRPPGETPVKSGDHFSSVGTGLPRMCIVCACFPLRAFRLGNQLNGHTDANIHNKLSRDLHRISSSTFDFYRLLPVLLSYIEMQKHGISISYCS